MPLTVDPVAVVEPGVDPIYAPPPGPFMVKPTAVPSVAAFPFTSLTVNVTTDCSVCPVPAMPITCGEADTNWILPVSAGEMVIDAGVVVLILPDVADIVAAPALLLATNVVVAVPLPFAVVLVAAERMPRVLSLRKKLTIVPSGTGFPALSSTVAVTVDVPRTVIDAGFAVMFTTAGGGVVIVTVTVADNDA